jgi:hypothetical protein
MGVMVVVSAIMGIYYVKKDTRRHRKWMLSESLHSEIILAVFINVRNDSRDGSVFLSHYLGPLDHVIGGQHNHDNWHLLLCGL